ncbi:hypothetical protein FWF74_02090, partial [Candidatus Saccharibacteria bacterium]|nr:hypothetical protein [Candidatus Saccharibacteria bacterium]
MRGRDIIREAKTVIASRTDSTRQSKKHFVIANGVKQSTCKLGTRLLRPVVLAMTIGVLVLLNFISIFNTTTALELANITPARGSIYGGQEVRIYGEFTPTMGVKQISAGYDHTCALDSTGQAYCWGNNSYGKLGNNSYGNSSVPVAVNTSGVLNGK